jgi:predicted AlkP superfamily pyrophosphatase or phosphodiesterase
VSPSIGRTRPRRLPALLLVLALATSAVGCTGPPERVGPPRGFLEMSRALGADVVEHLVRGYVPGRSGEIVLVPEPWNVLGRWGGGLRNDADPRTSHATPWSYHQRVPVILYGPGFIRNGERSARSVDVADLAPTFAELMGFRFAAPDGHVLREALVPADRRPDPPRAVVLVAYDGGGWNVLEQWPQAWPEERRLAAGGTTFLNATIGSSPSVTAPVHSTMGTGTYPETHGVAENTARLPGGEVGEVYLHRADPAVMRAETVADAWDRSNGNRPWVGLLGHHSWHLGMMGQGARAPGGDRDVAVLWDDESDEFWTNEEYYTLPDYLPPREALDRRVREMDASDGALDGRWRGEVLAGNPYWLPGTPAFAAYQGEAVLEIVRNEPLGEDRVTDLLFVELKSMDVAGHVWNMLAQQQEAILRAQDHVLGSLVRELDRKVGRGRYVLAITADHGQTPMPSSTGGLRIDQERLLDAVNDHFAIDVVEAAHPSELYVDLQALDAADATLDEVARWVGDFRYGEGLPDGTDAGTIPEELLNRRVFAAALPGSFLEGLTGDEILALGPGKFPEGDLHTSPAIATE